MNLPGGSARTAFVDPIRITLVLWIFVVLGATTAGLNPITPAFFAFVSVGVGAHLVGMALRRTVTGSAGAASRARASLTVTRSEAIIRQRRAHRAGAVLALALLAGLIYFAVAYAAIVPALDATGFLAARNAYLEEVRGLREKQFLYTTHLTLLGLATLFFSARAFRCAVEQGLPGSRWGLNALATIVFLIALMTTGRTAPLLVILSYSFFCLRFGVYRKSTILAAFALLSLSMFFFVALALGKEGLGDTSQIDVSEALLNLGRIYFFSAPVALQEVVIGGDVVSNACSNIFSYPIDLAKKLGLFANCDVRELDFVFVPVATNVYTFLRAYWEDFGFAFPLALFLSGYLIESIHQRAFGAAGFGAFIYPFVLNSVLLQIFEEQLFANGSVFAYLCASYLLCHHLYRTPARRARSGPHPMPSLAGATQT